MAPSEPTRKRQKLSPPAEDPQQSLSHATTAASPTSPRRHDATPASDRSSWYTRTWPQKAAPITKVAKESIASASNTAIETASAIKDKVTTTTPPPRRKSSLALTLGKPGSNKALPVEATPTKDHAMPQGRSPSKDEALASTPVQVPPKQERPITSENGKPADPTAPADKKDAQKRPEASHATTTAMPRSWIGWLAPGDGSQAKAAPTTEIQSQQEPGTRQMKSQIEVPELSEGERTPSSAAQVLQASTAQSGSTVQQRRSWLPIWNNATASQSAPIIHSPPVDDSPQAAPPRPPELPDVAGKQGEQPQPSTHLSVDVPADTQPQTAAKPSAWIFWSRENPAETRSLKDAPKEGEVAVANTETERKPRRASVNLDGQRKPILDSVGQKRPDSKPTSQKESKTSSKAVTTSASANSQPAPSTTKVENKSASATAVAPSEAEISRPASPAPPKKPYDHLLLPSLQSTLRIPENPTLFQQLARLFYATKDQDLKHLDLIKEPPRIKNALAIGVHGYFPAPLIQSVLGRPTGTSIKFADMAAKAIRRHTKSHGYECSVKTAALDGEGKIAERIDLLWKLLLNWIDEIRKSDFVLVACHSQGVPVAIMLIAKLIHFGCINNSSRVGICAMAGVNMGPFTEFKSRWMSGSAGELFEFADPTSKVSADYFAALDDILRFGVRLTYTGSIDDQLVSMESSIFAPISHPHIYRAVSIDSRIHAPTFISHLVAFALKLRNLGVQDHGLIRELSAPLAGSLYTGEGHSRLYEDDAIYDLAVSFALRTTSMPGVPLTKRDIEAGGNNPYILPFAMRGILEEDFVKSDLQDEAAQLLRQFDEWKPQTKALKDVKFRLEGIRSKL